MTTFHPLQAEQWALKHFGAVDLGDRRRNQRTVRIAQGMASRSGKSIPKLFDRRADVKAAYTFMSRKEATPERLQTPHRNHVRAALGQAGTFLLLEDSSEFIWSRHQETPGLGRTGDLRSPVRQGFTLHTTLAVKWQKPHQQSGQRLPVQVLGILDQEYYLRQPAPTASESDAERRQRENKESALWTRATERIGKGPDDQDVRWVRVCDRGADIEVFMRGVIAQGQGFVVRAAQNRRLLDPNARTRECIGHVFEAARAASPLGSYTIDLRGRKGQKARAAHVEVSVVRAYLWPTPMAGGQGKPRQEGIRVSIVRVAEKPSDDVKEPLEWMLLTDADIETFEEAHEVALQYQARWLVEEFHKGLKTGLGAERLQLEAGQRLKAMISMMSVVATRLLALREDSRERPNDPAQSAGLSAVELQVLSKVLKRQLKTVQDVILALGRLGGHMNRKSDGLPGWQALWEGMNMLQVYVEGYKLARI